MIFVPLPLFATLCLLVILHTMIRTRDMTVRANQLFSGLVGLYGVQSLFLSLRWGYGMEGVAIWIAILAPTLPVVAYFAYQSLVDRLTDSMLWPMAIVGMNWTVLGLTPDFADPVILITYLGFGIAILRTAYVSGDNLALIRIGQTAGALRAMIFTGGALVCSAFMDVFVIIDFVRTGGENIGLWITLAQSGFLLLIGLAAITGQSSAVENDTQNPEPAGVGVTEEDTAIVARLTGLFENQALHTDTDLNLRRLSRKLGLPDRSVSQAINKTQNMSVSQFVNWFRIRDACRLLEQTDGSILQISLKVGFLSKSNFNREFARITKKTPSQWRQSGKPAPL